MVSWGLEESHAHRRGGPFLELEGFSIRIAGWLPNCSLKTIQTHTDNG